MSKAEKTDATKEYLVIMFNFESYAFACGSAVIGNHDYGNVVLVSAQTRSRKQPFRLCRPTPENIQAMRLGKTEAEKIVRKMNEFMASSKYSFSDLNCQIVKLCALPLEPLPSK